MTIDLIQKRLNKYAVNNKHDEINAIKEIFQEIALSALSRTDFFKNAAFMGGTSLRILHGLPRFSEDLDFALLSPDSTFSWEPILKVLDTEFQSYELSLEVQDRSKASQIVKKAFLKENSFGKVLELSYERSRSDTQKILIKLEIDTNPPGEAKYESLTTRFPFPFSVIVHDLPTLCAGKCLAVLCRKFVKGRDWFDLLWYISQNIQPSFTHLKAGLEQEPEFRTVDDVTPMWLSEALHTKIDHIDWNVARSEVIPFLSEFGIKQVKQWNKEYLHNSIALFV